jgi:16S rRNA (cytosine1402-N4)-methyltransferase
VSPVPPAVVVNHVPVLVDEVVGALEPGPGEVAMDCTAGLGGHAAAIGERLGPAGTLILCDLDPANLAAAGARVLRLAAPPRVIEWYTNFADAPRRMLAAAGGAMAADVVLADLGFSSNQLDSAQRGLSFMREGPLDMRLDPSGPVTAAQLVNTLPVGELETIIREYGEERHARGVAQKLVEARRAEPITTTARLAAIVRSVVGPRGGNATIDSATRTFQALRIAVNDELGNLHALLDAVERAARAVAGGGQGVWLSPGARIGIIAFHSLEDRLVKRAFARLVEQGLASFITRKPLEASAEEIARNPRSRSAKLRAIRLAGR